LFRTDFWRRIGAGAAGFTLLETVVAMGLLSMAVGMVGPGVFQVLHFEQFWQDRVTATRELRHAGSRFAGDALGASGTDLADGVAAGTVTLTTHSNYEITYSKNLQDELVRSHFDGDATTYENTQAARVKSVEFLLSGDVITMTLEVYSVGTETKTMILRSTLR
jgi:type II secretory pathway pseudopilin PulG